jgi:tetratricopeptide (TPR) repeat protein
VGYRSLATFHYRSKEYQQADTLFRQAISILSRLVSDNPSQFECQGGLAWTHFMLGATLVALKKPDEAESVLKKSIEEYKILIRSGPNESDAVPEIHRAYQKLMQLKRSKGESTTELLKVSICSQMEMNLPPAYTKSVTRASELSNREKRL